jgi:hypothetical protein
MNDDHYNYIDIPGKHGLIKLAVPKRKATEEEVIELHRAVAEVIVNCSKQPSNNKKTTI